MEIFRNEIFPRNSLLLQSLQDFTQQPLQHQRQQLQKPQRPQKQQLQQKQPQRQPLPQLQLPPQLPLQRLKGQFMQNHGFLSNSLIN